MLKHYYHLTKPGIIYGNVITAAGGFFLASRGNPDWLLFIAMLLGLSLIVASGCVFNNVIDRDIDAKMERTKNRALVRGLVSTRAAFVYAIFLGISGVLLSAMLTNVLATAIALLGLFAYIFPYSLWSKRHTMHATTIGAISGATPPVVGYVAVTGNINAAAFLLFIILFTWQMPHAFAIAIRRIDEYAAASVPIFPLKRGMFATKTLMTIYVVIFTFACLMLYALGYTREFYANVMTVLCSAWLFLSLCGFSVKDNNRWGKHMFVVSLVAILALSLVMAVDATPA